MLDKLNHIAIAVPSLQDAITNYQNGFDVEVSSILDLPEHGVRTAFIKLSNTNIELLEPLGKESPILNFLKKNINGGIHHVCYEVDNIYEAANVLQGKGAKILGDGKPKIGAHGKPVLFLHPKEFFGTLIELEQG